MRTCCCSLPVLDPKACDSCNYADQVGKIFIPFDPNIHDFTIDDGRYIITLKKVET